MASGEVDVSERIKVVRLSERGVYDREEIYPLLDKSFLCHVGLHH
jgi:nitroimidazol reductase NimA-like FMN-containing flavoprotein (pyridoxamine 5'-phosphate oxidase superfamily)